MRYLLIICLALVLSCRPVPANPPPVWTGGGPTVIVSTGGVGGEGGQPAACRAFVRTKADAGRTANRAITPRIVGGKPVDIGVWPATAALETEAGFQFCGGTLIKAGWVATAAHCEVRPGERVVLGRADLRTNDGESIEVVEVRTHELYFDAQDGYDVAVVRLAHAATAPPADMVPSGWQGPDVLSEILGWGLTTEGASGTSPILRGAEVPIWATAACTLAGAPWTAMCAAKPAGGVDTCQGDSGGGLLVQLGGPDVWWALAGITSFGEGCARPGKPGIYTAVGWARPWIEACTQ